MMKGMNPTFYIALVFGLTIAAYLLVPDQTFFNALSKYQGYNYQYLIDNLASVLLRWDSALTIAVAAIATYTLVPQSFPYVFFATIATVLLNAFVFPVSFIDNSGLPTAIILMIKAFLNISTMLAVVAILTSRSG